MYVKLAIEIDGKLVPLEPADAIDTYLFAPTRENAELVIAALNPEGRKAYEAAIWAEVEKHEAGQVTLCWGGGDCPCPFCVSDRMQRSAPELWVLLYFLGRCYKGPWRGHG